MRVNLLMLALTLSVTTVAYAAAPAAPQLRLGDIQAQLYFSWSGRFSDDLLRRNPQFSGWNTCIDDGAPNDVLVSVPVNAVIRSGQDGQTNSSVPIILIARAGGKVIGQRTVTNILTSHQGVAHSVLWLRDVTCGVGTVTIEARMGNQRKTASLVFDGGE